jgi:hypothetical protein
MSPFCRSIVARSRCRGASSWPRAWTSHFDLVLSPTRQRRCGKFLHGRAFSSRHELTWIRPALPSHRRIWHTVILGPASLSGDWSFRKGGTATSFQVDGKLTIRRKPRRCARAITLGDRDLDCRAWRLHLGGTVAVAVDRSSARVIDEIVMRPITLTEHFWS